MWHGYHIRVSYRIFGFGGEIYLCISETWAQGHPSSIPPPPAVKMFHPISMKGTEVLTLSAHNLEKMMTTPYHQHSYLSSSVPVSQLMHSCTLFPLYCTWPLTHGWHIHNPPPPSLPPPRKNQSLIIVARFY